MLFLVGERFSFYSNTRAKRKVSAQLYAQLSVDSVSVSLSKWHQPEMNPRIGETFFLRNMTEMEFDLIAISNGNPMVERATSMDNETGDVNFIWMEKNCFYRKMVLPEFLLLC